MKKISIFASALFMSTLTFSACSKAPEKPYYDRAQEASQKAHNQLRKD